MKNYQIRNKLDIFYLEKGCVKPNLVFFAIGKDFSPISHLKTKPPINNIDKEGCIGIFCSLVSRGLATCIIVYRYFAFLVSRVGSLYNCV
jgi:hypothetical protein